MEIKKADSKGRVSGFIPGELYAFDRERGYFSLVVIKAPDGRPVEEALKRDIGFVVESGPMTSTGSKGATFIGHNSPRQEEVERYRTEAQ